MWLMAAGLRKERFMDFLAKTTDEMTNLEIRHMNTVKELAGECLVLLENDGTLPIRTPGKVALYGNGARHTVKGGGGSGEVNTRGNVNICDGLAEAGFEIASKGWLDRYDETYNAKLSAYLAEVDRIAKERNTAPINIFFEMAFEAPAMPKLTEEDVAEAGTDTAIFVISRDSSEGRDRKPEKGDYYLTDEESANIDFLTEHFGKVIILLNVGAVIDMSELKHRPGINSILLVGQIGNFTGNIVADAILGKVNPSGKLVDTWAKSYEDYPFATDFSSQNGNTDDEFYKEGIYVGYRYFDSFGIMPLYPFGYGKSYTTFATEVVEVAQQGADIKIVVRVLSMQASRLSRSTSPHLKERSTDLTRNSQVLQRADSSLPATARSLRSLSRSIHSAALMILIRQALSLQVITSSESEQAPVRLRSKPFLPLLIQLLRISTTGS